MFFDVFENLRPSDFDQFLEGPPCCAIDHIFHRSVSALPKCLRLLLEGAHFRFSEVHFACRCPALRVFGAARRICTFLQRRACHVGAVALGNHTALENLPPLRGLVAVQVCALR